MFCEFLKKGAFCLARFIGIDLGTSSVLIYVKGKGIVLDEPSAVAVNDETGELVEIGRDALMMLGRTPAGISVIKPMSEGVISKYEVTLTMLQQFIKKATAMSQIFKPIIAVCVPSGITDVEERAVRDAATQIGARYTYLIEEPLAAAIGAGVDIMSPDAQMVVDIGGGTTDIAVISYGQIAFSESVRVGGDKFDEAITRYVRRRHNLLIGERTAEKVKTEIGSVWQREEPLTLEVKGRGVLEGLPKAVKLTSSEMVGALEDPVTSIVEAICAVIEKVPPEMLKDITKKGIIMTGGGSMLYGLDRLIANVTGIKTRVAENAISCVAIGTGMALERYLKDPGKAISFTREKKRYEFD
ncbi:MAG: rod shape-determining protein [Ruminococcaceae bacterium]|nr:rod shape-determining protein [Oscillospiraceae bacterium]